MNNLALSLIVCLLADSSDPTVLSTVERFFYRGDYEQAAEMIEANLWTDEVLWSEAGLLLELCGSGFSVPTNPLTGNAFHLNSSVVSVSFSGFFQTEDSIRLALPVPSELPWQTSTIQHEPQFSGFVGEFYLDDGYLVLDGLPTGIVEVSALFEVEFSPEPCPVIDASGSEEAMVPFPGESDFLDQCLITDTYWAGSDRVYMEAVRLASREPNPLMLVERLKVYLYPYFANSDSITEKILLTPISDLALSGELNNSLGGSFLGASILRNWQIPAIVAPGCFGQSGEIGFILATYAKPFEWMIISPYPEGFVAFGSSHLPEKNSWFNGIPGVSFQAEFLGEDGLWHAVPVSSEDFSYTVELEYP